MAVDVTALRKKVNAGSSVSDDDLSTCLAVADEVLKQYAGDAYRTDGTIPVAVAEKAWLAVAAEIFNQDKAPNGVLNQAFAAPDGSSVSTPIRIGTDPLRPAYGLLERWVIGTSFA